MVVPHDGNDSELIRVVPISCVICRQSFPYWFVGTFHENALLPIDRVRRPCFSAWYRGRSGMVGLEKTQNMPLRVANPLMAGGIWRMPMKGLIIRRPWINLLLDGTKSWEIRGARTTIRGTIALIQSGSGLIMGTAELINCLALTPDDYRKAEALHRIPQTDDCRLPYPRIYAWVLDRPQRLAAPVPYRHPQGAVIWVDLPRLLGGGAGIGVPARDACPSGIGRCAPE